MDLQAPLPLDPQVRLGRLENGLTYYLRRNAKPEGRAEFRLAVNAGSLLEDDDQRGLAHFVEHMAFNGTQGFEKQQIVQTLESLGMRFGPELNAHTGYEETVYQLQVPAERWEVIETALRILEEWAHRIRFEAEEIEKERSVVLEEWRLGRGAEARILDQQNSILFQGSRYAERRPIGDPEVLRSFSRETLLRFYRDWYRPDLMAVIAVGDFDAERLEAAIRERFGSLRNPENPRPRPSFPVPDHEETRVSRITDPEATVTRVTFLSQRKAGPFVTVADYRRLLVEGLFSSILNQRFRELVRRPQPPCLEAFTGRGRILRGREFSFLGGRTPEGGAREGLEALLLEWERIRRFGVTASELERQKLETLKRMEQYYRERGSAESGPFAEEYVRHFLEGEAAPGIEFEFELYRDLVPLIMLEEVNAVGRRWIGGRSRVILVSAPEKGGAPLPSEAELLGLLPEIGGRILEPYQEEADERPLLAETPAPGRVTAEESLETLGLTSWRLNNGATVLLKPTSFKSGEILFSAFAPGGSSLAADDERVPAATSAAIVVESGLGVFSRIELEKRLAGSLASVRPWIEELDSGFRGSASGQDLETLLQLVYLYFTSPRLDKEAFAAYRERLKGLLQNRLSSPEAVFYDTLQKILTRNHPRARPWDLADLDRLDEERSFSFFRQRFNGASGFTFIMVGDFNPREVRPLVETYLGGLPAGNPESWKDLGIRFPDRPVEKILQRGQEPKSRVQVVFGGPSSGSWEDSFRLKVLAEILDIRLRNSLREDSGGTYSIGVWDLSARQPVPEHQLHIGFGCDPGRARDLAQAVLGEVRRLRAEECSQAELEKVKGILRREHEVDLKENSFWLQTLQYYRMNGMDPALVMEFERALSSIRPDELKALAARYLAEERVVRVLLFPEGWRESP